MTYLYPNPYPAPAEPIGPYQRAALERERDKLLLAQNRLDQREGARLDEIIALIGHGSENAPSPSPTRRKPA